MLPVTYLAAILVYRLHREGKLSTICHLRHLNHLLLVDVVLVSDSDNQGAVQKHKTPQGKFSVTDPRRE